MPSPFPGMDPYLEGPAYWSDFHASFLLYLRDVLLERLPENYDARIDEKVNLTESAPDRIKPREPDLAVTQDRPTAPESAPAAGVATLEPVIIPHLLRGEETHERWIEILHRPERSLVTVLELLSPANKEQPGFRRYLDKRNDLLWHAVHLIELDLLLGGTRLPLRDPLPSGDYYALVSRGDRRPDCQVYAWTLRQRLPVIPVPLKAPDPDLAIDLQAVFATMYEKGRYARSPMPLPPPSTWAPRRFPGSCNKGSPASPESRSRRQQACSSVGPGSCRDSATARAEIGERPVRNLRAPALVPIGRRPHNERMLV
jgi:hypothetical protein